MEKKIRIPIAKPGLDGHDRGTKVMARAFRDAGMEVIYTGLRQTPSQIASVAMQEDVDVVGLSILSGAHLGLTEKVMRSLEEIGEKKPIIVGGVIPKEDIERLKALGVAAVFPSGTPMDRAVEFVRQHLSEE